MLPVRASKGNLELSDSRAISCVAWCSRGMLLRLVLTAHIHPKCTPTIPFTTPSPLKFGSTTLQYSSHCERDPSVWTSTWRLLAALVLGSPLGKPFQFSSHLTHGFHFPTSKLGQFEYTIIEFSNNRNIKPRVAQIRVEMVPRFGEIL